MAALPYRVSWQEPYDAADTCAWYPDGRLCPRWRVCGVCTRIREARRHARGAALQIALVAMGFVAVGALLTLALFWPHSALIPVRYVSLVCDAMQFGFLVLMVARFCRTFWRP